MKRSQPVEIEPQFPPLDGQERLQTRPPPNLERDEAGLEEWWMEIQSPTMLSWAVKSFEVVAACGDFPTIDFLALGKAGHTCKSQGDSFCLNLRLIGMNVLHYNRFEITMYLLSICGVRNTNTQFAKLVKIPGCKLNISILLSSLTGHNAFVISIWVGSPQGSVLGPLPFHSIDASHKCKF